LGYGGGDLTTGAGRIQMWL